MARRIGGRSGRSARTVALALLAAGVAMGLSGCLGGLFFHPDQQLYTTPARFGLAVQELWIDTADGERLHAWWLPARTLPGQAARGTVVHAHGNAANISNHLPQVAWLPPAGFHVLTFDYRGFGLSSGRPTLDGVVADTRAALAAARRQPGVDAQRLVLLGQSLGGATALRAAAQEGTALRALVVDAAFDSYRGIARDAVREHRWLVWLADGLGRLSLPAPDDDPLAAIGRLQMPVLLLHGEADRVVPVAHGERLAAAARPPGQVILLPGAGHIDALTRPAVREQMLAFLAEALGSGAPQR